MNNITSLFPPNYKNLEQREAVALLEKIEKAVEGMNKGRLSCNGDEWYFNRWCWIDDKGDPCRQEINFCPICGKDLKK